MRHNRRQFVRRHSKRLISALSWGILLLLIVALTLSNAQDVSISSGTSSTVYAVVYSERIELTPGDSKQFNVSCKGVSIDNQTYEEVYNFHITLKGSGTLTYSGKNVTELEWRDSPSRMGPGNSSATLNGLDLTVDHGTDCENGKFPQNLTFEAILTFSDGGSSKIETKLTIARD